MNTKYFYVVIILTLLLCVHEGIGQTMHGVIIGDTDLVAQYDLLAIEKENPQYSYCFPIDPTTAGWYFPSDYQTSPFQWWCQSINGRNCLLNADVYFSPQKIDTISSWRRFRFLYEGGIPPNGCTGIDTFSIIEYGYGIKPDSMVLIRPKVTDVTLSFDTSIGGYRGLFTLLLTNNTASDVAIKSIELQIDTNSKIGIKSVKDNVGNYPTKIISEVHKEPINLELKSTLSPQKFDQQFNGTVLFHLSRLGKDSVYSSSVKVSLPAYIKSSVKQPSILQTIILSPNPCSDKIKIENIEIFPSHFNYCIYDLLGHSILHDKGSCVTGQNSIIIPLSNLSKGTFILQIWDEAHFFTQQFIVM